ncbi:MAG: processing protein [Candidatus Midichloriaceae bacterium]|nr:processing protein [Candidatus Midichloriaceae bacterium]
MLATQNTHTEEAIERLRLIRSENVGPQTFKRLLNVFGTATNAIAQLPTLSARGGLKRKITICSKAAAEDELEKIKNFGATLLFWDAPEYPESLRSIEDYPPVLTIFGRRELLQSEKIVGIVGSRNASANGCYMARDITKKLADHNVVITSGLARGIDACAHEKSLKSGTIAVIANGVDVIYPSQNNALYKAIAEEGVIVTEYPFSSQPIARNFPQRNRIISGLSKAIIVIEASQKSGSLITASYAKKQDRKVFAIPGSPLDSKYSGCNLLIKNGDASLLLSEQDIIDYLNSGVKFFFSDQPKQIPTAFVRSPSEDELNKFRPILHSAIGFSPTSIEEIIVATEIPYYVLNILLLELEIAGQIERTYGNKVNKIL